MPNTSKGALFEEEVYHKLKVADHWLNLTPYEPKYKPAPGEQQYTHKQFTSQFKHRFNFNPAIVWSKLIEPDFLFFDKEKNIVMIFEAKCQTEKGSVDEKLQTGGKKLKRFRKLFKFFFETLPENVFYIYLLKKTDFDKPAYKDTFDDIHEDECEYYFVDKDFTLSIDEALEHMQEIRKNNHKNNKNNNIKYFYTVELSSDNFLYYFTKEKNALNFLWDYYINNFPNESEEDRNIARTEFNTFSKITGVGWIHADYFEDEKN